MPSFDQMSPGRFLKKEDFPKPTLLTISGWSQENVARDDQPKELKWVVHFHEMDRGVVTGPVQQGEISEATGTTTSEETIGKKIVAWNNPAVMMGPKRVGGIRFRAPQGQQPEPQPDESPTAEDAPF